MITGYNTDVKHREKVFHVQTEDKGLANPTIESLIYCGGKILASRQSSYAWLLTEGRGEKAIQELLDAQHRKMLRDIQGGKYDPDGPPSFGAGIISSRSFDELVLEFIHGQLSAERLELVGPGEDECPCAGSPFPLEMTVRTDVRGAPVAGAAIRITAHPAGEGGEAGAPVVLFEGTSDDTGRIATILRVPDNLGGGSIRVEARGESGTAEASLEVVG